MAQGPIQVSVVNSGATGNSWFVSETTGSDHNSGSAQRPFATLDAAISHAVANNNDVVYLIGSSHRTTTLNWNKNGVSLVGLAAPSDNDRARISSSGPAAFSPLVNVAGQGCSFVNLGTFHGGFTGATGSQVCWAEAGGRNFYSNVQFLGGGDATTAALPGMRSLTIAGSGENLFAGCTIGLDTIVRASTGNASLELLSGTARNIMRECVFQANVSAAADVHITVGAAAMDRYLLLDNCSLINVIGSGATPMTAAITANASAGGMVLVQGGLSIGANLIAASGPVFMTGPVPVGAGGPGTGSNMAVAAT